MKIFTYVDNSNFFIEGRRVSAVGTGLASDIYDAIDREVFDNSWEPDYGRLHQFACGEEEEIGRAKLWGSPPPGDSFWDMVERQGFDVETFDKSVSGEEKKVDTAITHQITKETYILIDKNESEIVLISGDKDYMTVINDLVSDGYSVSVYFWGHAARELKERASNFVSLNDYLDYLSR